MSTLRVCHECYNELEAFKHLPCGCHALKCERCNVLTFHESDVCSIAGDFAPCREPLDESAKQP